MCKDLFISLVLLFLQVAFLAAEVGPRVAASCASAALSVLTREDSRWATCAIRDGQWFD
jgi:hypothetical protein